MKKGCFVKLIFILTILTAVILYVIQNKFDQLILEPGKKLLSGFTEEKIKNELYFVKPSPQKDSLIMITKSFQADNHFQKNPDQKSLDEAEQLLKQAVEDSVITSAELRDFRTLTERLK